MQWRGQTLIRVPPEAADATFNLIFEDAAPLFSHNVDSAASQQNCQRQDAQVAMLPEPTLSFTLPSLEGGTLLDCRIYHPRSLTPASNHEPWERHSAIVAHPYGPMGGCYDDGIVDLLASTLLRTGYLVATFNFRYASQPDIKRCDSLANADMIPLEGRASRLVAPPGPLSQSDVTTCRSLASSSSTLTFLILSGATGTRRTRHPKRHLP